MDYTAFSHQHSKNINGIRQHELFDTVNLSSAMPISTGLRGPPFRCCLALTGMFTSACTQPLPQLRGFMLFPIVYYYKLQGNNIFVSLASSENVRAFLGHRTHSLIWNFWVRGYFVAMMRFET